MTNLEQWALVRLPNMWSIRYIVAKETLSNWGENLFVITVGSMLIAVVLSVQWTSGIKLRHPEE